ncbi:UNVERIFIED_CONTAM: hypothetical protein Sradi_3999300 [Sesamum radiatum]|uniref:Uncharacterized protein n=1 Tax=Sesamum radiatum TaxID=300843 RepID=A0AAW2PL10_SESRA
MKIPSNVANKQKAVEAAESTQALQVVAGTSLTLGSNVSVPAPLAAAPPPLRYVDPMADPLGPRRSASSDTSLGELSPALPAIQ